MILNDTGASTNGLEIPPNIVLHGSGRIVKRAKCHGSWHNNGNLLDYVIFCLYITLQRNL